jgi:hypothetical protein
MKFVSTAICGFLTITAATALRKNSSNNDNKNDNTHDIRRHLAPGTDCVPFIRVMHYEDGHMEDNWFCEFNEDDAAALSGLGNSGSQMIELDVDEQKMKEKGAVSGGCLLKVGRKSYVEAIDDEESITANEDNIFGFRNQGNSAPQKFVLHVSANEDFAIEMMDEDTDVRHSKYHSKRRKLADKTGILNTLVVRVTDKNGLAAEFSKQEMYNNVFNDSTCLKSQYEACSYNNIIIDPAQDTTLDDTEVNGVVNINIDATVSQGYNQMENKAAEEAKSTFGNLNAFDLVMYCQPQSGTNWIAYAYLNDKRSFYNNRWCMSVSVHMHEVGHNIGLHHSGVTGQSEYEDKTGVMGYSYLQDDGPIMCFNAAKSYQLGWYPGATDDVDPRSLPGGSQDFKLNGVADYDPDGDGLVSLRLLYTGENGGEDYYVGYNRAVGMNILTQAERNKVHLYRKESGGQSTGLSWRMAALEENESHTWNVGNTEVSLTVTSIDGADAFVTLTGGVGPTKAPTGSPIPFIPPTASPVIPTANPTTEPVPVTEPPTASPVIPTANPTVAQLEGCSDDPDFRYKNLKKRNCAWLGSGSPAQLINRCGRFGSMDACPVTCDNPACASNPDTPTGSPTDAPTGSPTADPTGSPTDAPTGSPTADPTGSPTDAPTGSPTGSPTATPTSSPTAPPVLNTCEDDSSFRWKGKNNLTCSGYLKKGVKRKCKKEHNGKPVSQWCPKTCGEKGYGACA